MLNANEMLLNRKNETKLKQDGEKIVLFTDNLQGFKEEPTIRQAGKIKEKKKKNFIENAPVLIGWEKKLEI